MTRDKVKEIFPNATDEEIDQILNTIGAELNPLKSQLKEARDARDAANNALTSAQANEANYRAQLDAANAKLAEGMTAEEKLQKMQEEAAARETEFLLKSNGLDARSLFVNAGVFDAEDIDKLVAQVTVTDAEATTASAQRIIDIVTKQRDAVEAATKDNLLKANPKPNGGSDGGNGMSKEDFKKLSLADQIALKNENPDIMSQLN